MARAAFQVLVFPFRVTPAGVEYVLFRRTDNDSWQGNAGGGRGSRNSRGLQAHRIGVKILHTRHSV